VSTIKGKVGTHICGKEEFEEFKVDFSCEKFEARLKLTAFEY